MSERSYPNLSVGFVRQSVSFGGHGLREVADAHYDPHHIDKQFGIEEVPFKKLQLISLTNLFEYPRDLLLGFGQPNVFLTFPNPEGKNYDKFDAHMFWRRRSAVIPTKGRVQSGYFIRPRDVGPEIVSRLREAARKHVGERGATCARANAKVLTEAGFTSGGKKMSSILYPSDLFKQIYHEGIELDGAKLDFDIIRTSPLDLDSFMSKVRHKERWALFRLFEKTAHEACSTPVRAPLIPPKGPLDLPARPSAEACATLEISRPSSLGLSMRSLWGRHDVWRLVPKEASADVNAYLPEPLQAFPQANPGFVTRIKRDFLFSKPVVQAIGHHLALQFNAAGDYSAETLARMALPSTPEALNIYNIVITGQPKKEQLSEDGPDRRQRIIASLIDVKNETVDWVLSKHVLLSGYHKDVRFAGEARFVHEGRDITLKVSNNSGTYRPSEAQLAKAVEYLGDVFRPVRVEAESQGPT